MKPLLSIVVPTKNRYVYLKHLIQLIDSFKSREIELVIQDNSDRNDEIIEFLNSQNYSNVKYFYRSDKLSMSGNSDSAILNSTGEYVCFIGDDDGVSRNIINCVKWMDENGIEALRSRRTAFVWADSTKNNKSLNNSIACVIYDKPKLRYRYLNPNKELKKVLKKGFQTIDYIPILYNGVVKRSVLNKVYEIGNTFFPGGSPDISNGVSLSFYVKKMVYVDFPVVISGTSRMTGGGIYKRKGRSVALDDVGFIDQKVIDNWEKDIPRIWAGRLAWPESGIKALRYTNKVEYIKELNRNYMYASFAIYYSQHYKTAFQYAPNKIFFLWHVFILLFLNGFRVLKNKVVSFIFSNRYVGRYIERDIQNIEQAEIFLAKQTKNINFNDLTLI